MAKLLSYQSPPALAIGEGDTLPDPGGASAAGAVAWSTTLAKPVYWTGANWTAGSAGGGGGGNANISTVSVLVQPAGMYQVDLPGVSVPGLTASSKVAATLSPSADWDADDLAGYGVTVTGTGAGTFGAVLTGPGPIVGTYNITVTWSAA